MIHRRCCHLPLADGPFRMELFVKQNKEQKIWRQSTKMRKLFVSWLPRSWRGCSSCLVLPVRISHPWTVSEAHGDGETVSLLCSISTKYSTGCIGETIGCSLDGFSLLFEFNLHSYLAFSILYPLLVGSFRRKRYQTASEKLHLDVCPRRRKVVWEIMVVLIEIKDRVGSP